MRGSVCSRECEYLQNGEERTYISLGDWIKGIKVFEEQAKKRKILPNTTFFSFSLSAFTTAFQPPL